MKKIVAIIGILLIVLSGCNSTTENQRNAFNNNDIIIESDDTYNFQSRLGKIGPDEFNKHEIEYKKFYGTYTLWSISSEIETEITINVTSEVDSGDFKLVIINSKNEVENIFEGSGFIKETIIIGEGDSRIKMVGNRASGSVQIEIELDESIELVKL